MYLHLLHRNTQLYLARNLFDHIYDSIKPFRTFLLNRFLVHNSFSRFGRQIFDEQRISFLEVVSLIIINNSL